MAKENKQQKEMDETEAVLLVVSMCQQLIDKGCVPLFLVGGKEIGSGYRNYVVAGQVSKEHILYAMERITKLLDGTIAKEVEGN